MRARLRDTRFRFAVLTLLISVVLFIVWPGVSAFYRVFVSWAGSGLRYMVGSDGIDLLGEKDSYALIPIIAIISASQGHTRRRKAAYIGLALALFLAIGTLTVAFDLVSGSATGADRYASDLVFALLDIVVPVAVLVFFVGGEPALLWSRGPEADRVEGRCPLCGERQPDLSGHVRSVHGLSALNDPRVRRRLKTTGG